MLLASIPAIGQELYVFTDPASNLPARSITTKLTANYVGRQDPNNRTMQRYTPEVMFGLSKKWMVKLGGSFADMHTIRFRWESIYLYGKYRFLSHDDVHAHFRMALFGEAAHSRSPFHFDEIGLDGDKSGLRLGLIATQLWNKLAVSTTISHTQVLDKSRHSKTLYIPSRIYQAMNYSLSAGYLVLPLEYTDYRQTNLNLYLEVLGQQSLDRKASYLDLAPALQLIFNSNTKFNLGYRFEVSGDMLRMARHSWQVSVERTLLNAIGGKKK